MTCPGMDVLIGYAGLPKPVNPLAVGLPLSHADWVATARWWARVQGHEMVSVPFPPQTQVECVVGGNAHFVTRREGQVFGWVVQDGSSGGIETANRLYSVADAGVVPVLFTAESVPVVAGVYPSSVRWFYRGRVASVGSAGSVEVCEVPVFTKNKAR